MPGVSLTVPLMKAIAEPEIVSGNAVIAWVCGVFGVETHHGFVILCILAMIAVFIIKDLLRISHEICRAERIQGGGTCPRMLH